MRFSTHLVQLCFGRILGFICLSSFILFLFRVTGVSWSLSQLPMGEGRVTPQMSRQLIAGPHTHRQPFTLTFTPTDNLGEAKLIGYTFVLVVKAMVEGLSSLLSNFYRVLLSFFQFCLGCRWGRSLVVKGLWPPRFVWLDPGVAADQSRWKTLCFVFFFPYSFSHRFCL